MNVIFPKGTPRNVQDGVSQLVNKELTTLLRTKRLSTLSIKLM